MILIFPKIDPVCVYPAFHSCYAVKSCMISYTIGTSPYGVGGYEKDPNCLSLWKSTFCMAKPGGWWSYPIQTAVKWYDGMLQFAVRLFQLSGE